MDVNNDGQRIADRIEDKDIMDTTLDNPQEASSNGADPEAPTESQVAGAAELNPIPDKSTEKDDEAQQSSKQMRKTLILTLPDPSLVEHGLTNESRSGINTTSPATHAESHFLVRPSAARSYSRKNRPSHRREDQQDEKVL